MAQKPVINVADEYNEAEGAPAEQMPPEGGGGGGAAVTLSLSTEQAQQAQALAQQGNFEELGRLFASLISQQP